MRVTIGVFGRLRTAFPGGPDSQTLRGPPGFTGCGGCLRSGAYAGAMWGFSDIAVVIAQQATTALRALIMTALVVGLGGALIVGALLLVAARRRWMRRLGREDRGTRTAVVDAWAESARRMGAAGPHYAREALDGGSDDDTVDFDPDEPDGRGRGGPKR